MAGKLLFLFVLSMMPIIELRGAVPVGIGWGLPFWVVYAVSVAGNLAPVPFLIPFAGRVLRFGATLPAVGGLFRGLLSLGDRKVAKALRRDGGSAAGGLLGQRPSRGLLLAIYLFVAIPAPGTGAWTGCLIATLLQLRVRDVWLPIAAGVASAGLIMGVTSYGLFGLLG